MTEANSRRAALRVGVLTLIFTSLLCGLVLVNNDFDPLNFAYIGTRFSEGDPDGTTGYDGQFVYFIARDGAEAVPYIDGPTLRYQRIIYPLVGRVLALGIDDLVPWTLLAVNILAHSIGAGLVAYLLAGFGASPWGALLYTFWIGNLFAIRFSLTEPLCFALALAAIIAYQKEHYRWTIFLLILSTLTKELGAVITGGLAFHAALSRGQWRWASLIFGGPVLAFLAWWGVMRLWLGTLPTQYPAAKVHLIPLEGMFTVLQANPELDPTARTIQFVIVLLFMGLPTVILSLLALWTIYKRREIPLTAALMLAGAGFVMVMPDVSWQDLVAVFRVGLPLIIAGILFMGQCYPKRLRWLILAWFPANVMLVMLPQLWLGE